MFMQWVFITIILFVLVIIFSIFSSARTGRKTQEAFSSISDFHPTMFHDAFFGGPKMALDMTNRKIGFSEYGSTKVLGFDDILSVEALVNGSQIQKTNRGSQAVGAIAGGLLLGPAGLLVGGLTAASAR